VNDNLVIWERVEEEETDIDPPSIDLGESAPQKPKKPDAEDEKRKEANQDSQAQKKKLLPHMAFTVWNGHLIIASHLDFLMKIVAPKKQVPPLADEADYKAVNAELAKFADKRCLQFFSRTDEEYRPVYELIRENKMPQSQSLFGKLLNGIFGSSRDDQTRKQRIDGGKLPPYDVVRRYLGPAGLQVVSEDDGWYLKGFWLTK
jgi:hypothetical protein